MKTSSIFWGTLFIVLGLLVLLNNVFSLSIFWGNLWNFWPVILVLLGVAILVKNKFGKMFIAASAGIILAVIIYSSIHFTTKFIQGDFDVIFDDDGDFVTTQYSEPFDSTITKVKLYLDGGAGKFTIGDTTDQLIFVRTDGIENNFKLVKKDEDNVSEVWLKMKKTTFHLGKNKFKNEVDISLNDKPLYDFDFDVGAASVNMDLTPYKIENIDLEIGAASLDTKLSALADSTKFNINAGASEIKISIPGEAGCQLKVDDVLSSVHINGLDYIRSGLYRSDGFDEAQKKIYINIDCGVSSIKINRY